MNKKELKSPLSFFEEYLLGLGAATKKAQTKAYGAVEK